MNFKILLVARHSDYNFLIITNWKNNEKKKKTKYDLCYIKFQTDLSQNGDLAENETLRNLWQWLGLSRQLVEDGTLSYSDNKHPGVRWKI